jgi:hypothetical protein
MNDQLHALAALLRGKCRRYPLDKRLSGPQNRSGRRGEEKNLCPYLDSNSDLSVAQAVASRYTDCAIPAPNTQYVVKGKQVISSSQNC